VKDIHDVITHAKFGDDRLRGQISAFPIDFAGRPYNTLALPCERVISLILFGRMHTNFSQIKKFVSTFLRLFLANSTQCIPVAPAADVARRRSAPLSRDVSADRGATGSCGHADDPPDIWSPLHATR